MAQELRLTICREVALYHRVKGAKKAAAFRNSLTEGYMQKQWGKVCALVCAVLTILSCASNIHETASVSSRVISTPLPQQAGGGFLQVQVVDENGAPLPGVFVAINGTLGARTGATDMDGRASFVQVPSGLYDVSAELQSYTTIEQSNVQVLSGKNVQLNMKLKPGQEELVVVTGEAPVVDVTSTTTGVTIGGYDSRPAPKRKKKTSSSNAPVSMSVSSLPANVPAENPELIIVAQNDEWSSTPGREEGRKPGKLEARNDKGETIGEFPLRHTEVDAEIGGFLARTVLQQEYTNPYEQIIEAVYVFPLPSMSAVHDFEMEVNGHRIVGIVRPRGEAEEIYRAAREQGMTASLLTQERDNIFTQNIANIEPGGNVTVRITYFERLVYESGFYEYALPLVVGPRYIAGQPIAPDHESAGCQCPTDRVPDADRITPPTLSPGEHAPQDVGLTVRLDAGMPIQNLRSDTHDIRVEDDGPDRRIIRLSGAKADRDFVLRWSVAGEAVQFGVLAHRTTSDGFFTLMIQPPLEPADSEVTPREITFIMDVSGSMQGLPIGVSKELVQRALHHMRPEDIFNIVYFSGSNGQLWNDPRPPTPENLQDAETFLNTFRGSGGTEMMAGLQRALSANHDPKFLQMYVFLTDGFVGEDQSILHLIRETKSQARFFAFGIGTSVNRYLIEGIAESGGGFAQVVIPQSPQQAEGSLNRFFAAIDSPVLVDPKIDWGGVSVKDVYPKHLGDLFAGQTISVVGRYEEAVRGPIYIHGRVGSRPVRYKALLDLPAQEASHEALGCLWARQKIHELSIALWKADPEKKQELVSRITDLAVKYRLASDYTSFVAVDESRIAGDGKPLKILQPVEIPAGSFGTPILGSAQIPAWGMQLYINNEGKVVVADVDKKGLAAQSGVKQGAVLHAVNHVGIHDIAQLEAILLQSNADNVNMDFEKQGLIILPRP